MNILCIVARNHERSVVLVDSGYNIENQILIQGRGNYCSKLKKGKLKTKGLLKITILDEQEPSAQSADRSRAVQV